MTGGVQIKIPDILTAADWCAFYGVKVLKGVAVIYKAVDAEFKSPKGYTYAPGMTPIAADWDGGKDECGGGLHFSPKPFMALGYSGEAKKFVACPVALKDMRAPQRNDQYEDKIKARCVCAPCYEVDINGNRVEDKKP